MGCKMGQIIDFKNLSIPKGAMNREPVQSKMQQYSDTPIDQKTNTDSALSLLLKEHNGKFNYSIKDCAEILNLSYEFVRRQVQHNKISSINYGDKKMISILELARIITKGV